MAELAAPRLITPASGLTPSTEHVVFADDMVRDSRPGGGQMTFKDLICLAYLERINLGERGFYATPGIHFDRDAGRGHPFQYYTNGAACAEVLIDRFTGDMKVSRVDLLMDAGIPLNPGIDRGQVIGGFIQGMGWCTTEELKYSDTGALLSHSPTTYKIPNASDTPRIFNMAFFNNPDSVLSIKRSKALGEPPLLLGLSVWAAVKDALTSAAGDSQVVPLSLPATNEQILMRLSGLKKTRIKAESMVLS